MKTRCPKCKNTSIRETLVYYIGLDRNIRTCNECGYSNLVYIWDKEMQSNKYNYDTEIDQNSTIKGI